MTEAHDSTTHGVQCDELPDYVVRAAHLLIEEDVDQDLVFQTPKKLGLVLKQSKRPEEAEPRLSSGPCAVPLRLKKSALATLWWTHC